MLLLLIPLLTLATVAPPCESTESEATRDRCALSALQLSSSTVAIDGRLDEAGWSSAPAATNFRQLRPQEGTAPSQRTHVHILYGEDALYVGAILYDDHPDRIQARLTRRDQRNQADWFEVSIDSYYDQKTARTFAVNAAGVQRDGVITGGGGPGGPLDTSWDAIWRSDVRITNEGWVVEMRIPYTMLRFSQADEQTWGVQFRRRIPRNSEIVEWPLVPESQRESNLVAEYGVLTGLRNLSAGRNVQVAPYTMGRVRTQEDVDAPGTMQATSTYDLGADFEIGLSSNTTLNATINPDFGQVESDPAVLNLSAFETFFDEKRPFFVQGTDVFNFSLGRGTNLLYTRRIGASAPVIGALKLTGRSQNGLAYGAMAATTGDDFSPQRNYGVVRMRQDFGVQSRVGGMVTAFDGPSAPGRQRSYAGGLDWDVRFLDNQYQFQGYVSSTHNRSTAADADPTTGLALNTEIGRSRGIWTYDAGFTLRDNAFNPNNVGQMRENNFFRLNGGIRHQINGGEPFGPFQRASGFLFTNQSWSYEEGLNRGFGFFSRIGGLTRGFNELSLQLNGDQLFGGYDLFETRGLWPRTRPRSLSVEVSASTDSRRSWEIEAGVETERRSDGGAAWSTDLEVEWNVSNRLNLSSEVSFERERGAIEWASNEAFVHQSDGTWAIGEPGVPPSELGAGELRPLEDGHGRLSTILADVSPESPNAYYVPIYGARDTDNLDITLRSNFTLTRSLSVEFFGQLFAARGQYRDFRILSARDRFDRFSAYPRRHDFATSSFLTNAVLRWEFLPGSELFVVWSQNRQLDRDDPFFYNRRDSPYNRSTTGRLTDAFDAFPQNAFIVKLRYLFY